MQLRLHALLDVAEILIYPLPDPAIRSITAAAICFAAAFAW
jgi:hypothetical protein